MLSSVALTLPGWMYAEKLSLALSQSGDRDQEHRQLGIALPACLSGAHHPELSRAILSCTSNAGGPGYESFS